MFENFSNAQLAAIFNAAVDAHSLDAKPVKRFASKAVAIGHLEATMAEFGLSFDGENLVQAGEGGHDPEGQTEVEDLPSGDVDDSDLSEGDGTEPSGEELVGEPLDELDPAPFVKLPKDQLPARGTPEREAYRKARRAAARAARKAREAAE